MRYVMAKQKRDSNEMAYRIYITESIYWHNQNKAVGTRYCDVIKPKKHDNRSGDEIAMDVINRLGLVFENECI